MLCNLRFILTAFIFLSIATAGVVEDRAVVRDMNARLHGVSRKQPRQTLNIDETLAARAGALARLIRTAPGEANALMLSSTELHEIREASGDGVQLERADALTGVAEVLVIDSDDGRAVTLYRLQTNSGAVEAFEAGVAPQASCGALMRVEGMRLGSVMAVSRSEMVASDEKPVCGAVGPQKVAVLLVYPPGTARPDETAAQFREAMFGPDGRTATNFYAEASYGRTSLTGDVFGWYETDRTYTCADTNGLRAAAIRAADADVDFTAYTRIYIVQPFLGRDCGWRGLGTIGCSRLTDLTDDGPITAATAWGFFEPGVESTAARFVGTFIHEVGHNYGLGHSRSAKFHDRVLGPDRQRAEITEYGDPYSTMGRSINHGHFAGAMKVRLGWLTEGEGYQVVEAGGAFRVSPLESQAPGVKALRILRNRDRDEWIWLEYRQSSGLFDGVFPETLSSVFKGALLRLEDPATGRASDLLDATPVTFSGDADFNDARLEVGTVWRDLHSPLTIEAVEATDGVLTVNVRYDEPCAAAPLSSNPITYSAQMFGTQVGASGDCRWTALANNFWLSLSGASQRTGSGPVDFEVAENSVGLSRTGSVTIDRRTTFLEQRGIETGPEVASFYPQSGSIRNLTFTPVEVVARDVNGTADFKYLDLLWNTEPNIPGGCAVRYDFTTSLFRLWNSSATDFIADSIPNGEWRNIGHERCAAGYFTLARTSPTDITFRAHFATRIDVLPVVKSYVRLTDRTDRVTGWNEVGTLSLTTSCIAIFRTGGITIGAGRQTFNVDVSSVSTCTWEASTSADWLRFARSTGTGEGRLSVTADALPEGSEPRIAELRLGEHVFVVTQTANQPPRILLDFSEASFGATGGSGWIDVSIAPASDVPVSSDSEWIRAGVTRLRASGLVPYSVRLNTGERRVGRILVGDQVFTVVQGPGNE